MKAWAITYNGKVEIGSIHKNKVDAAFGYLYPLTNNLCQLVKVTIKVKADD